MSYFTLSNGEQLYYEDTEKGDQTIIMMHGWFRAFIRNRWRRRKPRLAV